MILDGTYGHSDLDFERQIFLSPKLQLQFQEKIVAPLSARYAANSTIFAYDILNESNNQAEDLNGWDPVLQLIQQTAKTIHSQDPQRLVSCSLIKANAKNMGVLLEKFSDLGLDFFDLHQYSNSPDLPIPAAFKISKPIVLGEYGQVKGGADQQAKSTQAFLEQTKSRGWAGAFLWSFDFPGSKNEQRLLNEDGGWRPSAYIIQKFGVPATGH